MHARPGRTQQGVSVLLELELETVVNCHVDTGNKTQVLLKTSECSKLLSYPSSILIRPVQLFEQLFSIVTKAGDIAHAQDSGFTHCPINK